MLLPELLHSGGGSSSLGLLGYLHLGLDSPVAIGQPAHELPKFRAVIVIHSTTDHMRAQTGNPEPIPRCPELLISLFDQVDAGSRARVLGRSKSSHERPEVHAAVWAHPVRSRHPGDWPPRFGAGRTLFLSLRSKRESLAVCGQALGRTPRLRRLRRLVSERTS